MIIIGTGNDIPAIASNEERERKREKRKQDRERKKARREQEKSEQEKKSVNVIDSDFKIASFLQSVNEASPLLKAVFERHSDLEVSEELKEDLLAFLNAQKRIIEKISKYLKLDSLTLKDRVAIRHVTATVSEMMADFIKDIRNSKEVSEFERLVMESIVLIHEDEESSEVMREVLSTDRILNIKLSLFDGTSKMKKVIDSPLFEQDASSILNSHLSATVEMAKDLAFNWSKRANVHDQEALFELSLSKCSDIYINAFIDELISVIQSDDKLCSKHDFWRNFPALNTILDEMDMGYKDHKEYTLEWLKANIAEDIYHRINRMDFFGGVGLKRHYAKIFNGFLTAYADLAADAWSISSERYISLCESLTEEEFERWAKTEGLKPMDIETYYKALDEKISDWEGLFPEGAVDLVNVEKRSKKELTMLWGISDAICKVKNS